MTLLVTESFTGDKFLEIEKTGNINQRNNVKSYIPSKNRNKKDSVSIKNTLSQNVKTLSEELDKERKQQGIIGSTWDGLKNLTGIGYGSNKVDNAIKQLKKGEIKFEDAKKILEDYKDGQKTCVDVVADIFSGIISIGAFALAVPSGGMGLAAGLVLSTAVGAGIKTGIKCTDAKMNDREYNFDNALYDAVTGGVNGILAPVTNGLGNTLIKTIGAKLGLEIVGESAKTATQSTLKRIILNQSIDVTGGSLTKRAAALGAGMALDGSISGGIYGSTTAVMEGKNAEETLSSGVQGFIGGLIMAPVIGGGFRLAGKLGKKYCDNKSENANNSPKPDNNETPAAKPSDTTSANNNPTVSLSETIKRKTEQSLKDGTVPEYTQAEQEEIKRLIRERYYQDATFRNGNNFSNEEYFKAKQLLDLGYGGSTISGITKLNNQQFQIAKELIERGYNCDGLHKIVQLDEAKERPRALEIIDTYKDCNGYTAANIAKLCDEDFLKAKELLNIPILKEGEYVEGYSKFDEEQFDRVKQIATILSGIDGVPLPQHVLNRFVSQKLDETPFNHLKQLLESKLYKESNLHEYQDSYQERLLNIAQMDETSFKETMDFIEKGKITPEDLMRMASDTERNIPQELLSGIINKRTQEALKKGTTPEYTPAEQAEIKRLISERYRINYEYNSNPNSIGNEQYFRAKQLLDLEGYDGEEIFLLTKSLDEQQFQIAKELIERGYKGRGLSRIARLDKEKELPKALEILETYKDLDGYNVVDIVKLNDEEFSTAKELLDIPIFKRSSFVAGYSKRYSKVDKEHFNQVKQVAEILYGIKYWGTYNAVDSLNGFVSTKLDEISFNHLKILLNTHFYQNNLDLRLNTRSSSLVEIARMEETGFQDMIRRIEAGEFSGPDLINMAEQMRIES